MQIKNPHDKIFKETFSNVAKDFITHFLSPSVRNTIDVASIQPQKDSFISHDLQEYFSDLLFQTKIHQKPAYVYFLFEHKRENTYQEGSELAMTLAEIFRNEGKEEGRAEGKEEGKAEALANTAIRLIAKFVARPSEDIKKKIHDQEISTLETIIDHIDEFKTIEDVKQYLK